MGVKIVAKKVDLSGNLEVFVLRVGCWWWVFEGGKMNMINGDLVPDSQSTLKKELL